MKIKDILESQFLPLFGDDTDALQACVVMVLGRTHRHHLSDLVRLTGYPKNKVILWKKNLIRSGIWNSGMVFPSGVWDDSNVENCVALAIDTLVCLGKVSREWNGKDYSYCTTGCTP